MGMEIEDQAFASQPGKIIQLLFNLNDSYLYIANTD